MCTARRKARSSRSCTSSRPVKKKRNWKRSPASRWMRRGRCGCTGKKKAIIDGFSKAVSKTGERAVRVAAGAAAHAGNRRQLRMLCDDRVSRSAPADEAFYAAMNARARRKNVRASRRNTGLARGGEARWRCSRSRTCSRAKWIIRPTTGVAVDRGQRRRLAAGSRSAGEVYLDNGSSIAAFTPGGRADPALRRRTAGGPAAGWRWIRARGTCSWPSRARTG